MSARPPSPSAATVAGEPASLKSFEAAYARHAPSATRFAYVLTGDKEAADDIVQEAFVRLCGRYRDLADQQRFEGYLHKTVLNLARDRGRKLAREHRALARVSSSSPTEAASEESEPLWDLVLRLPARQRAVIYFRYYEDLSEARTADMIGSSVGAVKSLSQRAFANLREGFKKGLGNG